MARERIGLTISDGILLFYLFALIHSSLDIMYHGDEFGKCQRPIHWWLMISYVSLVGLRLPHYLRQYYSESAESEEAEAESSQRVFLKGFGKTCLMGVWFLLLPFFMVWTVFGSFWLAEVMEHTPACLPVGSDARFIIFWQVICYSWIVIYSVCVCIALRVRIRQYQAERNYREIENDDVRSRWGSMSAAWTLAQSTVLGLSAKEISSLPATESLCKYRRGCFCEDTECSICLSPLQEGDAMRTLPVCGHSFHQACIDLWLLRQNKCPLCKADVVQKCLPV